MRNFGLWLLLVVQSGLLLVSLLWLQSLVRKKSNSVSVWGKWTGWHAYPSEFQWWFSYAPTATYPCPFSDDRKKLTGIRSTAANSWREAGDPVEIMVQRTVPHSACFYGSWLMQVILAVLFLLLTIAMLAFVILKS